MLAFALLGGCSRQDNEPVGPPKGKVAMVMYGGIKGIAPAKSRAMIEPQGVAGLPPTQLDVNIITVNYVTDNPRTNPPGTDAWRGQTADVTRGFFGENTDFTIANDGNPLIPEAERGDADKKPNSGRIEYTDEDGSAVQKVFYDDSGEYYFVRLFYPYENAEFTSTTGMLGASIIFSGMDGSQDILCTNLGWGNIYNPEIRTAYRVNGIDGADNEGDSVIVFSHMLSLFRIKIAPENTKVIDGKPEDPRPGGQYGQIMNARIREQPGALIADAMGASIAALYGDPLETDYLVNGFPYTTEDVNDGGQGTPLYLNAAQMTTAEDIGYIMVLPGLNEYRIEVNTGKRKWVYGDLKFTTPPQPGKVYDITITMMEAYELKVVPVEATNWWMDHVFD